MFEAISLETHGLWGHSASPAPVCEPLSDDIEIDVAVVGAGYTGLSTALHLAEFGDVSVAVLEAHDIGAGASGRNAGLVNAGAWLAPDELPARLGAHYGERLLETLGEAPALVFDLMRRYAIDCHAVRNGNLHCAADEAGLADIRERARQWRVRGVPVELLGADETSRLVGTKAYLGALLDPRAGTIQPLSYARGLAKAAISLGARIHTSTAVTGARHDGAGWQLATSTGHTVRAGRLVVATNTRQFPGADAWPELQTAMVRFPYFNVATSSLPLEALGRILPERQGAWDSRRLLSSFHVDGNGRLVYGSVGRVGQDANDAHVNWVRRCISRLFPDLKGLSIEYQWYGWIDMTANNLPDLYQPGPDAWAVYGYNGRGIGPGTTFGRMLANLVSERQAASDAPLPVKQINPIGFKRLREVFYEKGSKGAHLLSRRF